VFLAPPWIWWVCSSRVAARAGLTAFVDAGAGRRAAWGHALVWSISYFLYLPYTVTFIVYDLLPAVFPGVVPYPASLELLLPVAITILQLGPIRLLLGGVLVLAAGQLALMLALRTIAYSHVGAVHATGDTNARSIGNVSLLFVCASLPPYFRRGGGRRPPHDSPRARRQLPGSRGARGLRCHTLTAIPAQIRDSPIPGFALAQAYVGRGFALAVGVGTAASVAA
jgi:hypothetical protein